MGTIVFKKHLGTMVVDSVSGVKGIITARQLTMSGNERVVIQPQSGDGSELKSSWWVDIDHLSDLLPEDNVKPSNDLLIADFNYDLLSKVKSSVTEEVGTVTACTEYLNGCKYYSVTLKGLVNGSEVTIHMTEKEISKVVKPAPKGKEVRPGPGGPSCLASSLFK